MVHPGDPCTCIRGQQHRRCAMLGVSGSSATAPTASKPWIVGACLHVTTINDRTCWTVLAPLVCCMYVRPCCLSELIVFCSTLVLPEGHACLARGYCATVANRVSSSPEVVHGCMAVARSWSNCCVHLSTRSGCMASQTVLHHVDGSSNRYAACSLHV
jgi:hypothetical protein